MTHATRKLVTARTIARAIAWPIVLSATLASAQTTTPTDPAVLAAQTQQALADAQLKIQQDQQAMLTGALPASTATPNSGGFTVSGTAPFPSQKLAYAQLNSIAHDLVTTGDTFSGVTGPIVFYDTGEINNLLNYNALLATLTLLNGQAINLTAAYSPLQAKACLLQQLANKSENHENFITAVVPGLILGSLKTASDIIGMFRTNTSIAYNAYTPDDTALIAAVGKELLAAGKSPVYLPAQMPLSLNADDNASTFLQTLAGTQKTFFDLQTSIGQDQANLQQLSDALGLYIAADQANQTNLDQFNAEPDPAKKLALKTKQAGLERATTVAQTYVSTLYGATNPQAINPAQATVQKAMIDHLLKSIAILYAAVSTASTGLGTLQNSLVAVSATGTSSLTAILRAEALLAQVRTSGARILSVKTSVLGGAVVTRQNPFTGGHLFYTGGAIVNFVLFDAAGHLLHSGVLVSDDKGKLVKY